MSFPTSIVKAVIEYVQGIEGWNETMNLAAAANADLHYGDTSSEDYPGFEAACREVFRWLANDVGTLYVEEDSGCVMTREPEGEWLEGAEDEEGNSEDAWCEPMPYYTLDANDVASILFGSELARHL